MLEHTFYTLQSFQYEQNAISAQILLHKEHPIFEGHFPNNPVTPGVCMLQIIKELTQKATGNQLFLQQCSQVKFMALINPETHAVLHIDIAVSALDDFSYKIKSSTRFDTTVALKMQGILKQIT